MAIKIFQNLRSLLPIPGRWSDEGKSFALKIEDAYKWLQTQMANDRENTEASKAKKILLGDEDNSWEKIWDKIDVLSVGEAADIFIYSTITSILTNGRFTTSEGGVIWRTGQGTFRFIMNNTENDTINYTISGASRESSGTFEFKIKSNTIRLTSSDNSWAKIWAKISVLNTGETATIFCNNTPYSIINGGTDDSGNPSGTICRTTSTTFNFLWKWTGNDIFGARIDNASSSSAGTYSATFYHQQIGTLSSLDTSSKTSLVSAINEVNGKILKDNIVYQSSATTHKFTVPTGSRNLVIFSGDGTTYAWIGYVYGSSNGSVTTATIYQGSRVTNITTATNEIKFTFSAASSCYLRSINLRNGTLS